MALDRAQAAEMVALARARGVFLAEALWTFFLPKFDVLAQVLDAGILGEIKSVHTDYGEHFTRDHRIFDPRLAGGPLVTGALSDAYGLNFAMSVVPLAGLGAAVLLVVAARTYQADLKSAAAAAPPAPARLEPQPA